MASSRWSRRISAVAALGDGTRRALFDYLRRADRPVGRDEAAQALGLTRGTAAAQLDRLADEGLLQVEFAKPGPGGPGTGRPSKFYTPVQSEITASVPERSYELAGELMATAAERSMERGGPISETLQEVGRETGTELGRQHGSVEAFLEATGYHPAPSENDATIELENCPFHRLASGHRAVVCALNTALLEGALTGCHDSTHRIEPIEPGKGQGECCARLIPR